MQAYSNKGDYRKALEFYAKAFSIREKSLPLNHMHLAISKHDIGQAYENMGKYLKAIQTFEGATEIIQISLPSNHPHLALYRQRLQHVRTRI